MKQRANRTMYAVLGFLTWRPMSGYDIKQAVEQSTANFWCESYGQIYPILRRLTEAGLAERCAADQERTAGRDRQVYRITEPGRAELRRWLVAPTEPPTVRIEFLLKLFFARQVDSEAARRQVEAFRRHHAARLDHYEAIRERLSEQHADSPDLAYWLLTLRYGELSRTAVLQWCEEALAVLENMSSPPARTSRKPRGATPTSVSRMARGARTQGGRR